MNNSSRRIDFRYRFQVDSPRTDKPLDPTQALYAYLNCLKKNQRETMVHQVLEAAYEPIALKAIGASDALLEESLNKSLAMLQAQIGYLRGYFGISESVRGVPTATQTDKSLKLSAPASPEAAPRSGDTASLYPDELDFSLLDEEDDYAGDAARVFMLN